MALQIATGAQMQTHTRTHAATHTHTRTRTHAHTHVDTVAWRRQNTLLQNFWKPKERIRCFYRYAQRSNYIPLCKNEAECMVESALVVRYITLEISYWRKQPLLESRMFSSSEINV